MEYTQTYKFMIFCSCQTFFYKLPLEGIALDWLPSSDRKYTLDSFSPWRWVAGFWIELQILCIRYLEIIFWIYQWIIQRVCFCRYLGLYCSFLCSFLFIFLCCNYKIFCNCFVRTLIVTSSSCHWICRFLVVLWRDSILLSFWVWFRRWEIAEEESDDMRWLEEGEQMH